MPHDNYGEVGPLVEIFSSRTSCLHDVYQYMAWQRAIVGSYKGTCRYFNTTGLNSPYLFCKFQLYKVLWLITKIAAYSIFPNQWIEVNAL
jgi:hypothetical protein